MQLLCAYSETRRFAEVWLDDRFAHNYLKVYRGDGFAERAWLTAIGHGGGGGSSSSEDAVGRLVESVHRLSSMPIVVMSFGGLDLLRLDPARYPRLVVLHARSVGERKISTDFNKMQAILLSRLKVGVFLDPDVVMVNPHADELLSRTKVEVGETYPYPIMPVHHLDRDPEDAQRGWSNYRRFSCGECPKPTMRWGQGQPSWTFWALPFLTRWQMARLTGLPVMDVPTSDIQDLEELLNVALWREGAYKEWCPWQPGPAHIVWRNLIAQHAPGPSPFFGDPKYFPHGAPVAFFFVRGESEDGDMKRLIDLLEERTQSEASWPNPYYHNMKFYSSFRDLKEANPNVPCIL